MVDVGITSVENKLNDNYSMDFIIMKVTFCIVRFRGNIWQEGRCRAAFGDMYIYAINISMLNWFRLIYLDANNLISSDCMSKWLNAIFRVSRPSRRKHKSVLEYAAQPLSRCKVTQLFSPIQREYCAFAIEKYAGSGMHSDTGKYLK